MVTKVVHREYLVTTSRVVTKKTPLGGTTNADPPPLPPRPPLGFGGGRKSVGRDGVPLQRFEPMTSPEEIGTALAELL